MQNFRAKKDRIVQEIFDNYYNESWMAITHCRDCKEIPKDIQILHFKFINLKINPALSEAEERKQIEDLKKIRKKLKVYYKSLNRKYKQGGKFLTKSEKFYPYILEKGGKRDVVN